MKRFFDCPVRLRIISDTHLEYMRPAQVKNLIKRIKPTIKSNECLALLGDIGHPQNNNYKHFIREMSYIFSNLFVIAGNHEYYRSDKTIDQMNEHIRIILEPLKNVMFMEQDSFEINFNNSENVNKKIKLLGTTLWSHIPKPSEHVVSEGADFRNIQNYNPIQYNKNHNKSVQWLKQEINESKDTNLIVLTHHAPTFHNTAAYQWQYKTDGTLKHSSYIFASNLEYLLKPPVAVWAFGHTHWKTDYYFRQKNEEGSYVRTRIISNPHGYPSRFNDQIGGKFNPYLSIPLDNL